MNEESPRPSDVRLGCEGWARLWGGSQFFVQQVSGKSLRIRISNKFPSDTNDTLLENTFYKFNQTANLLYETVMSRQIITISCSNAKSTLFFNK